MQAFVLSVIASLVAAWLWDRLKESWQHNEYMQQALTAKDRQAISRLLENLKGIIEEIQGDMIEEIWELIRDGEPRWKVGRVIARTGWELFVDLVQIALGFFVPVKGKTPRK